MKVALPRSTNCTNPQESTSQLTAPTCKHDNNYRHVFSPLSRDRPRPLSYLLQDTITSSINNRTQTLEVRTQPQSRTSRELRTSATAGSNEQTHPKAPEVILFLDNIVMLVDVISTCATKYARSCTASACWVSFVRPTMNSRWNGAADGKLSTAHKGVAKA
jgi:hypothetical protein